MDWAREYSTLRSLSEHELEGWVESSRADRRGRQWWLSVVDSAETEARSLLRAGRSAREVFAFAVAFLEIGERRGEVERGDVAYWFLRLAKSGIEFGVAPADLPEQLRPDGAASRALAALPLTAERAMEIARRQERELAAGIDGPARPDDLALMSFGTILTALAWLRGALTDADVEARVAEWTDFYERLP